tara:strand:- start:377 stop:814 length:438 start_codon:yes stop_codon:yes gene_type:complete
MSSILVDNLTGKTTAGNVTVTSEGGAATMHMQQGLCKAWVRYDATNTDSINDSLNISSVRDGSGAGKQGITLSSAMNNTNWSVQCTGTGAGTSGGTITLDSSGWQGSGTSPYRTTTQANMRGVDLATAALVDHDDCNVACFGDLA